MFNWMFRSKLKKAVRAEEERKALVQEITDAVMRKSSLQLIAVEQRYDQYLKSEVNGQKIAEEQRQMQRRHLDIAEEQLKRHISFDQRWFDHVDRVEDDMEERRPLLEAEVAAFEKMAKKK